MYNIILYKTQKRGNKSGMKAVQQQKTAKMQLSALFCSLVQVLMAQEMELVLRILAQTPLGS
jgi:hypothetical protein